MYESVKGVSGWGFLTAADSSSPVRLVSESGVAIVGRERRPTKRCHLGARAPRASAPATADAIAITITLAIATHVHPHHHSDTPTPTSTSTSTPTSSPHPRHFQRLTKLPMHSTTHSSNSL